MKRRRYRVSLSERLHDAWDLFLLCKVKGIHRIKMGSHGRCIRCAKQVER